MAGFFPSGKSEVMIVSHVSLRKANGKFLCLKSVLKSDVFRELCFKRLGIFSGEL